MKAKTPPPAPCTVVQYENGQPVEQKTVVRDPLPAAYFGKRESERVVHRFRVMAEQETGEELFVSYASTLAECDLLIAIHEAKHPEHRAVWLERL